MIPTNFDHTARALRASWIRASGIPNDLLGIRLAGTRHLWGDAVYTAAFGWLEHYYSGERPTGKGLLLVGEPGRGKTTLAAAILQEALIKAPAERLGHQPERGRGHSRPGLFVPYARHMATHQALIQADRTQSWDEKTQHLQEQVWALEGLHPDRQRCARLAVVDDLGKEHATKSDWTKDTFDLLLRTREAEGWPTIVTSNVEPRDWSALYGESMGSFMHQAFHILPMAALGRTRDMRRRVVSA